MRRLTFTLTREQARIDFYSLTHGYRDVEVAQAIEGRIPIFSTKFLWSIAVRVFYHRYAKFLSPEDRKAKRDYRRLLINPEQEDNGRELAL